VGDLQSVAADGIVVATGDETQFIPFDDIARANYEHRF
jgi:ribosome maturation factor RimP